MPIPMTAGLVPDLELTSGYLIRFTALDPTTGLVVPNVTISSATIQVENLAGTSPTELVSGPFLLVPGPEG